MAHALIHLRSVLEEIPSHGLVLWSRKERKLLLTISKEKPNLLSYRLSWDTLAVAKRRYCVLLPAEGRTQERFSVMENL
jgi:hypothetical protein